MTYIPSTFWRLVLEFRYAFSKSNWIYFVALIMGWILTSNKQLVSRVFLRCRLKRNFSSVYRFLSQYSWVEQRVVEILVRLIERNFGSRACQLVGDDTYEDKSGRKIFGTDVYRRYAYKHKRYRWAQNWVSVGISVYFVELSRWIFFPVWTKLYVRRKRCPKGVRFQTRLELINEGMQLIQKALSMPMPEAVDGAFAKKKIIEQVNRYKQPLVSRIRKDARLYEPKAKAYKGRGRRPKYGERMPRLEEIAKASSDYQRLTVNVYGRRRRVGVKEVIAYWCPAGGVVKIVIVKGLKAQKQPSYLVCTKPGWRAKDVIEHFSGRWPIEQSFRDGKQLMGFGKSQARVRKAVIRHANFSLWVYSLVKLWYLSCYGPCLMKTPEPWYPQKSAPSFADMLNYLRYLILQEELSKLLVSTTKVPKMLESLFNCFLKAG